MSEHRKALQKSHEDAMARAQQRKQPLTEQITTFLSTLRPDQINRGWCIKEFTPHLVGKLNPRPAERDIGQALRELGWVQVRDCSKDGRNRRLWYPPDYNTEET